MRKILPVVIFIVVLTASLFGQNPLPETKAYRLDIKIDFENQKLYGRCEMLLKNRDTQPVAKVPVLLYRLLTVRSVENGEKLPIHYTQEIKAIDGFEKVQVNYTEVLLPEALMPGEEITLVFNYDGYLLGYAAEGLRYIKDHIDRNFTMIRTDGCGYPVVGYANDRDMMAIVSEQYDYEINVTVQNGLTVVTGGEMIDKTEGPAETTFKFRSKKPSWRIDIAVTDFMSNEKGKNKVYFFKNDSAGAQSMLDALDKSLNLFSEWFGHIDNFQGYSIIEVPEGYSSQNDVTAFLITADNFRNTKDMLTIYHEVSHLWSVKSLDPRPCRFESEGMAQFLEFLMSEKLENRGNAISEAAQRYLERIRKTFTDKPEYQNIAIKDYGAKNMTDYSYTLGMVVFAVYYNLIGQPDFNKMLESFHSTYSATGATLDEFIISCKKATPIDLEKFFSDWIYSTNGIKLVMEGKTFNEIVQYYSSN